MRRPVLLRGLPVFELVPELETLAFAGGSLHTGASTISAFPAGVP